MATNDPLFLQLVAATGFPQRYYTLCQRFPFGQFSPIPCDKKDVTRILAELGRTPRWDARDRSYSFTTSIDGWVGGPGFRILHRSTVEFWFVVRRGAECHGDSFARLANYAMKQTTPEKIPSPPFPVPNFTSHDELKDLLATCFDLTDLLTPLTDLISNPTNS